MHLALMARFLLSSDGTVKIGDIVKVKIQKAEHYDLHGEVVSQVPWKPNVMMWK